MNILFLTTSRNYDLKQHGIYPDLLREFVKNGHGVTVVSTAERSFKEETALNKYDGYSVLRVKIGNLQKTNLIEKGISTVMLESQVLAAIKNYLKDIKFDVVMYSTPPITFSRVISYIKKRDGAESYLLLKDIFPQNAVDLGMFSKNSIFYKYFRNKEKTLYRQSDYIGCMSEANVDYVIKHNPEVDKGIVHVSPNSIEVSELVRNEKRTSELRDKYNIPHDTTVFVYGGNLGKPQGIPFLIECLKANADKTDRFFVICGTGTEYSKLKAYADEEKPSNILLINGLPKDEYEDFVKACDVGLIFLDHRFEIPNFPSRMLSYMQNAMPVIACTDVNTDIGEVITKGGYGYWCESNNCKAFTDIIDEVVLKDKDIVRDMGLSGFEYLKENYSAEKSYKIIADRIVKG